jgi:hypothetical protein
MYDPMYGAATAMYPEYSNREPREVIEVHHTYEREHYMPPVYEPNLPLVAENNREGLKRLCMLLAVILFAAGLRIVGLI